ncbi:AraC family transcriptional regulator [Chryseobacterium indologenes]|nr:AraC family transcriptional regulator [Chryseobacterium indologenes]AYY86331.1 AraC family transcriptional regulator [Chryseobacterium indologenes]
MKAKFLKCIFFIISFFVCVNFHSQKYDEDYYESLRTKYEDLKENDVRALPFIKKLLSKAKKEKYYRMLVTGYIDALYSSPDVTEKLKYADSTIWAAHLSKTPGLISNAYLSKGSVYYFNLKKYQLALDEYLKAYEYSQKIDDYERNKIIYFIGVVKSYVGYYNEALLHFKTTSSFFESELKKPDLYPNIIFNHKRGYYNSVHQMIICYRNLGNYKAADSLINIGLKGTANDKEYYLEYTYFQKENGIKEYRKKEYLRSIASLQKALPPLRELNDFAWLAVDYFYTGKSYLGNHDIAQGIVYLQKVDSIFNKNNFVLPELRENYELLINHYKKEGNVDRELYFTKQLLRADGIINKDFAYLSSKIHKEYDTRTLLEERSRLEKSSSLGIGTSISLGIIVLILIIVLIHKFVKTKENREKYRLLEQKILDKAKEEMMPEPSKTKEGYKFDLDKNIINDIFLKLKNFEDKEEFIESGLTLNKLATRFDTNSSYLSQVINEYKGTNFNRYLGELRIHYITKKLYEDKKFLNYKIETLAEECGIASRTNFSNLFREINGMRPTDFIKKRRKDIDAE